MSSSKKMGQAGTESRLQEWIRERRTGGSLGTRVVLGRSVRYIGRLTQGNVRAMKPLTAAESKDWCKERGISISEDDTLSRIESPLLLERKLPANRRMLGFAAMIVFKASEEIFGGGLFYVRREEKQPQLWSDFWHIAEATLGLLRQKPDWSGTLEQFPGQEFGPQEGSEALAFVSQAMLFNVDAYFIPSKADYIAFLSHDEVVSLSLREQSWHQVMSVALH
jgi:hypothetical protein